MRSESDCPGQQELRHLMLGHLNDTEAETLEQHLAACPRCNAWVDELATDDDLTAAMRARSPILEGAANPDLGRLIGRLRQLYSGDGGRAALSAAPAPEAAGLEPPRAPGEIGRLGPYRILEVLGWGGMAVVYQAWQERPRRPVAVKMIRAAAGSGPQRLARFRGEIEIIARLAHPNIVAIYEAGEHAGQPFFAMEYLGGGTLAQKLAAPLSARPAAELLRTLAAAVAFAHERGVVHRDLKPSNVLLTADGIPKISDFGLARQLAGADDAPAAYRTESGAILGTPGYMAPEQAGVGGAVGPAADVYALGAILYEALTGRPPFKAATVLETLEQVRSQEPVPPRALQPGLPRDLQTICLKCLHKEPQRRYPSAADLADDLGRFLRGEPIRARPVSWRERLWKWVRRKPGLAGLLAACAVLLAALVAGGLLYQARLQAALERAEAEKAEARRQHQLAVQRYQVAVNTLRTMLSREGSLSREELSRLVQLAEDQLAFYQALEGAGDPDPAVRRDTAEAFLFLGSQQFQLGQHGPAADKLRRAIALLEGLPPEQRSQPRCEDSLAMCYIYLGQAAAAAGRPDERDRAWRQVLVIRQRLAEADPDEPVWQKALAQAEILAGDVDRGASRWAEAESHYTRALARYTRLAEGHQGESASRHGQGTTCVNLGYLYQHTHRPAEAGAAFAKAEEVLAPLVAAHPDEPQYRLSLAAAWTTWSDFLRETGQPEAARQRAGRAVDVLGPIQHYPAARPHARNAHEKAALACEALGLWADAVTDWDEDIALGEPPNLWPRRRRALALARAGDHARAAAEAEALAGEPKVPAAGLYEVACVYALAVQAARADEKLSASERQTLAERYGCRALAVLQKLQGQGYFQDAGHAAQLQTAAELKPLRGRLDFQMLRLLAGKKGKNE
jgi:tetratricopeptide (TPR) repeat protein